MAEPRFAHISDRYINVEQIVYVYKEGPERTLIATTADDEGPSSFNLPIDEVLAAIASAAPISR